MKNKEVIAKIRRLKMTHKGSTMVEYLEDGKGAFETPLKDILTMLYRLPQEKDIHMNIKLPSGEVIRFGVFYLTGVVFIIHQFFIKIYI